MLSLRSSGKIVGSSVSLRQLAKQHHLSVPISIRQLLEALGVRGSAIKHVFVLMLENRSFDNMLGFSGINGIDAETGQPTKVDGLNGSESNSFGGRTYTVATGAADVMSIGPGHDFTDVLEQLCGPDAAYSSGGAYPPIDNSGYVASYAKRVENEIANRKAQILATSPLAMAQIAALDKLVSKIDRGEVMKCFKPSQLPVLNALACEFVVCDHWFSSMPGPTEPNRMFMHAASSGKFDDSPTKKEILEAIGLPGGGFEFKHGTVFQLLEKAGVKYRIYAADDTPFAAEFDGISVLFDIRDFEDFAKELRNPSFNAGYIHIEPSYDVLDGFEDGNSQHPSGSVAAGERFIKATYEAIRSSPLWEKSLLIITWDEHGGFYDHAIPGSAQGTGERGRKHGFTFEQLGPRVPAVIVSPLIPRNLIEHRLFDHTAIPATLCRVFNLPSFGTRDGLSGGVDQLAVLAEPRTDAPMKLPDVTPAGAVALALTKPTAKTSPRHPDALVSDDPHGNKAALLHSAVNQHLQVTPAEQHGAILDRVRLLSTHAEVFAYLNDVKQLVHAKRVQTVAHLPLTDVTT